MDNKEIFNLILKAGNSKTFSMDAVDYARKRDFLRAHEAIKKASKELQEAHAQVFNYMKKEANGYKEEVSIILVHAQDHLSTAFVMRDFAEKLIDVYEDLSMRYDT